VVVAPGDPVEARLATRAVANWDGPCYLRLGRDGEPEVHSNDPEFQLGKAITVRDGSDITLISTGASLYETVKAADILSEEGIKTRILSMHTIKPLDIDTVLKAAKETKAIFTIEEHSII